MIPIVTSSGNDRRASELTHYPRPGDVGRLEPRDPKTCEKLLSDWFGSPVILLSSGRAGLNLVLQAIGFHRYRNRLVVPPFLSTCVLNAITPFAFPVDMAQNGDGLLWYHQYGFPQRHAESHPNLIEDCAHSFFFTPTTGERKWASDVAIFSLPKFFSIKGMAGGVVVRNEVLEEKLRGILENTPTDVPGVRDWMREIIASAFDVGGASTKQIFVSSAYELLLQFAKPNADDLSGFPKSTEEIVAIGHERLDRFKFVVDYLGEPAFPGDLLFNYDELVPFGIPCFSISDEKRREKADSVLREIGIHAGLYRVDIMRNCRNSEYRPCILLPCHQNVPMEKLEQACEIVASFSSKQ